MCHCGLKILHYFVFASFFLLFCDILLFFFIFAVVSERAVQLLPLRSLLSSFCCALLPLALLALAGLAVGAMGYRRRVRAAA